MIIVLFIISILSIYNIKSGKLDKNQTTKNKSKNFYYNALFNSIDYDDYNISLIYHNNYNSIKIKHKPIKYSSKKEICIFGVLCNDKGLKIENSLLNWLLPEYDVFCVYQKYPGKLYEYPALRFAQWLSQTKNISIILYIHTKGAFYSSKTQDMIRELWKHEFTKPKKEIYISLLKDNYSDIALPFRHGIFTWFNGMFISLRAFNLY